MKLEFLGRFLKVTQISNCMKMHLVGAELLQVVGWTWRI